MCINIYTYIPSHTLFLSVVLKPGLGAVFYFRKKGNEKKNKEVRGSNIMRSFFFGP